MQKQSNILFYYALMVLLLCLHVTKSSPLIKGARGLFFTILFLFSLNTISQQLQNPSFEGATGIAIQPQGWKAYGPASSPDTQPGAWNVTLPASHGNTYMSMVCRGYSIFDSYMWESAIQGLNNPLTIGETYHYSIDLATSKHFLADTIQFDNPVNFRIWGMSNNSEKELLWESGAVANTDWKTVYFEVIPNIATDYFILEAYYTQMPKYCGNVLVDNMKYYPQKPIIQKDTLIAGLVPVSVDNDTIPTQIDGREINKEAEFTFRGDKLIITVWDNRTTDGDVISLFLNNKNILKEFTISKDRLEVEVDVEEGVEYYLTLYAHNLGDIPPNTVAMYISDGQRKKFITLTSDLKACGAVKLKIETELANAELMH
ncbi:MAG: hypothetical protein JKX68_03495 [Flavobacteriales bacterium]|nr:hypothetical protein [Flavobacteriales bacterium]